MNDRFSDKSCWFVVKDGEHLLAPPGYIRTDAGTYKVAPESTPPHFGARMDTRNDTLGRAYPFEFKKDAKKVAKTIPGAVVSEGWWA